MRSAYDVLGIRADADGDEVRGAYVRLAMQLHPDRNPDPRAKQRFQQINHCYELLRDAHKRWAYDQLLGAIRAKARRRRRRAASVAAGSFALTSALSALLLLGPLLRHDPGALDFVLKTHASASHGTPEGRGDLLAVRGLAHRMPEAPEAKDARAQRANSSATDQPAGQSLVDRPVEVQGIAERTSERVAMFAPLAEAAPPTANQPSAWITYENDRFGFALDYPADVFMADDQRLGDFWRLFISRDGRARLLVTAGFNTKRVTPASHRRSLMSMVYGAATLEYAPLRTTWFVLAGNSGEEMFYERVTFACNGRIIHGWRLTYPVAARDYYSKVIERMHQGYKHVRGAGGHCEDNGERADTSALAPHR